MSATGRLPALSADCARPAGGVGLRVGNKPAALPLGLRVGAMLGMPGRVPTGSGEVAAGGRVPTGSGEVAAGGRVPTGSGEVAAGGKEPTGSGEVTVAGTGGGSGGLCGGVEPCGAVVFRRVVFCGGVGFCDGVVFCAERVLDGVVLCDGVVEGGGAVIGTVADASGCFAT